MIVCSFLPAIQYIKSHFNDNERFIFALDPSQLINHNAARRCLAVDALHNNYYAQNKRLNITVVISLCIYNCVHG